MQYNVAKNMEKKKWFGVHIFRMLLEEYLSPNYWNLQTSNQSDDEFQVEKGPDWRIVSGSEKQSSLVEMNSNILLVTLLLEGVGNFAKVSYIPNIWILATFAQDGTGVL